MHVLNPIKSNRSSHEFTDDVDNNNFSHARVNMNNNNSTSTNLLALEQSNTLSSPKFRVESVSRGVENTRQNSILGDSLHEDSLMYLQTQGLRLSATLMTLSIRC